jgi:hypothetical protein
VGAPHARRAASALAHLLKVTLEQLRARRSMSLADCFRMELDLDPRCLRARRLRRGHPRAARRQGQPPRWNPATLARSTPRGRRFFAPRWSAARHPSPPGDRAA